MVRNRIFFLEFLESGNISTFRIGPSHFGPQRVIQLVGIKVCTTYFRCILSKMRLLKTKLYEICLTMAFISEPLGRSLVWPVGRE